MEEKAFDKDLEQIAIQARRDYKKKWRDANKDKVRESNRRYWLKKARKILEEKEKNGE